MDETPNDVRCPKCDKLLARDLGEGGYLEIKCPRCGTVLEVRLDIEGHQTFTTVSGPTHNPKQWWAASQRKPGPEERK